MSNKTHLYKKICWGPSWSYGSWIYNYLCNQCLSSLMLWVRISIRARCTTLCDKVCQWLRTGRWFSLGPPVSFTNKTDRHDIAEMLLKVALKHHQTSNKRKIIELNGHLIKFLWWPFPKICINICIWLINNKISDVLPMIIIILHFILIQIITQTVL